jgi:hypothetical protein
MVSPDFLITQLLEAKLRLAPPQNSPAAQRGFLVFPN